MTGKKQGKRSKKRLVLPGCILFLSLLFSVGIYLYRTCQYSDWVSTPGIVVEVVSSKGVRRGSTHRIYFAFTVEGKGYVGNSIYGGRKSSFQPGENKQIWYDPKDPDHSSFQKPRPGLDPLGPWIAGIPLAVVSYRYRSGAKRKTRKV